jgi:prepilin-type N-terminal cleavage/methylation domain-containing protein
MAQDRVEQRREAGFTLIEVMIAILLTALTVIGVLGLYRVETQASSFSRRETEAAVLAQDKLEELRAQGAPSGASTGTDNPVDQLSGSTIFTRSWSIAANTGNPSIFDINVTVSWDDSGITRSVTVTAQRGGS